MLGWAMGKMLGTRRNSIDRDLVNNLDAEQYDVRKEAIQTASSQIEAGEPNIRLTRLALLLAKRLSGKEQETHPQLREQITAVLGNYVRSATNNAVPVPEQPDSFETVLREIEDFLDQQHFLKSVDPYSAPFTWEAFNCGRQSGAETSSSKEDSIQ